MPYSFSVKFHDVEHTVFVVDLEKPKHSEVRDYSIHIDEEKNVFDVEWDSKTGELIPNATTSIDKELIKEILSQMRNQPEFPYDFPGLERSNYPLHK